MSDEDAMSDRVTKRPADEQRIARCAYMVGLLNQALRHDFGPNLTQLYVSPVNGWLEFTLRAPAKSGKVWRLVVEERDAFAPGAIEFPLEIEPEATDG